MILRLIHPYFTTLWRCACQTINELVSLIWLVLLTTTSILVPHSTSCFHTLILEVNSWKFQSYMVTVVYSSKLKCVRKIATSDSMWHLVAFPVNYGQEILESHYCLYILSTWETSMYILTIEEEQLWYPKMAAWHFGNSILKTVYNARMMHYHSILSWQFAPAATLP